MKSWNPEINLYVPNEQAQILALQTMGTIIMHMSENKFV
jgi:hypothetical protein